MVVDVANSVWVAAEDRGVGMVFQDYALFPHLTVAQTIRFGLRRMSKKERQIRVEELLRLTELVGYTDRYPHELSGGQQQRVALARALAPRPRVVLLDEPFNGLDPDLRPQMRRQVAKILRHLGTAGILVTHDQEEALGMADRVAVIRNGELQQIGSPEDIYYSPTTAFVANFVGHADFIPGLLPGPRSVPRSGFFLGLPSPAGPVKVMIRHEAVNAKPGDFGHSRGARIPWRRNTYRLRLPSEQPSTWNNESQCIGLWVTRYLLKFFFQRGGFPQRFFQREELGNARSSTQLHLTATARLSYRNLQFSSFA
jgi:iron(III) transport system ATP-binding protein